MAKDGQAKVLSNAEVEQLFANIEKHRHPAKNALIMQISFKLGLRVQEISLLRVREVAHIDGSEYELKDVLVLPKSFTKGARGAGNRESVRTSVTYPLDEFDRIFRLANKSTDTLEPSDYYPALKKRAGKTRELPLADNELQNAIIRYLDDRIDSGETLKPNAPLILSQKGDEYTPNGLQQHMAKMFRQWTGIDRASSHSGRRTLATKMLHDQGEHLKTVQQVLGHKSAATTTIYQELPESEISKVLERTGKAYNSRGES